MVLILGCQCPLKLLWAFLCVEFSRLLDLWKVDKWEWMAPFQVDRHIYRVCPKYIELVSWYLKRGRESLTGWIKITTVIGKLVIKP